MPASNLRRRILLLVLCCPLLGCLMGSACTINLPGFIIDDGNGDADEFITIHMVNETAFVVDPGIFLDDTYQEFGLLDPGEDLPLDVQCFAGDVLVVDPILILGPDNEVIAAFAPQLEEGLDYLCGDLITLYYTQDVDGTFLVDVEINGVPVEF